MPHIAKLSKRFYDRLGEDVANELVDMYNAIDLSYRDELRELNDRNRALFGARLDQRFAEFGARMDERFAAVQATMDQRFAQVDARFQAAGAESDARFAAFETRITRMIADQNDKLATGLNRQMRWMFVAWATLLAAYIGLR